jgi:hypothetical protein
MDVGREKSESSTELVRKTGMQMLSRSPVSPAPQTDIAEDEVQVASVCVTLEI